jgi:hypothetical protein
LERLDLAEDEFWVCQLVSSEHPDLEEDESWVDLQGALEHSGLTKDEFLGGQVFS